MCDTVAVEPPFPRVAKSPARVVVRLKQDVNQELWGVLAVSKEGCLARFSPYNPRAQKRPYQTTLSYVDGIKILQIHTEAYKAGDQIY
jgi:hypothetical protein